MTSSLFSDLPILLSSESIEWYTPQKYIEAARLVMGTLDLDPASCESANRIVRAAKYHTRETNGLNKPWPGNVWLNPPYGRDDGQRRWAARLIEQFQADITKQAILLVNATTGASWFQPLWNYPICFTDHRIRFYTAQGESNQPTKDNAFVYFGPHVEIFEQVFSQFGHVALPTLSRRRENSLWEVSA
jgi:phage N-6-adenine-methyltransferase